MNLPSRQEIEAEIKWRSEHKMDSYYPDTGPLRRELYEKHLEFFGLARIRMNGYSWRRTGSEKRKASVPMKPRCILLAAIPRGGKAGDFHVQFLHGRRGKVPRRRGILSSSHFSAIRTYGRGMIPADTILGTTPKAGIPEAVETIYVRHEAGGRSEIALKSYDQGVESFYGTRKDLVWLDEECERSIYVECLLRTLTVGPGAPNGLIVFTFTPLWGTTEIVRQFQEAPEEGAKASYGNLG